MRTLQYFQKNSKFSLAHENIKRPPQKSAQSFFYTKLPKSSQTAKTHLSTDLWAPYTIKIQVKPNRYTWPSGQWKTDWSDWQTKLHSIPAWQFEAPDTYYEKNIAIIANQIWNQRPNHIFRSGGTARRLWRNVPTKIWRKRFYKIF